MTSVTPGDFPYDEIDRFDRVSDALAAGYKESQVWSMTEGCDGDTYCYGPSRHWVNLLFYVVTAEHHDDDTYYEESDHSYLDEDE